MATWPTITDDDGTGTTGTILDQAKFNEIRDYIGAWNTYTYSAGNFTGNGSMTWTVDDADEQIFWIEIGKVMIVVFDIRTSTVGGSVNTTLQLTVPNSRTGLYGQGTFAYSDNGTAGTGWYQVNGTVIQLFKSTSTPNWTLSTNATACIGTAIVGI